MLRYKVSIVIPAYNAEKYLAMCLDSCVNQTYKNIEVLIVNDGSTDNTQSIVDSYIANNTFMRSVYQENAGLVEARKTGVRNVKTEFFVFLDADDTLEDNAVELLVNEQQRSGSDFIFSNFYIDNDRGRLLSLSKNQFTLGLTPRQVLRGILQKKIMPPIWGRLIKTELFLKTDTPSNITIAEDVAALAQMLYYNPRISYVEENLLHYIQRNTSMVNLKNRRLQTQRLVFLKWFIEYINTHYNDKEIKNDLNTFVLSELFTFLRDGGSFKEVKELYSDATSTSSIFAHSNKIGSQRALFLFLFSKSEILGNIYRVLYIKVRGYLHS